MSSDKPEDQEKSLQAFKKCGNIDMCLSLAYKMNMSQQDMQQMKEDLIEILASANRFKEAGDLLCQ